MESFTTRDVARLLGLSETQVRSHARAGFLTPGRGPRNDYRFSFQDLVLLRTARELAQSRVSSHRIRSALRHLARELPSGRSLSEIKITAEGQNLVVHEGESAWNPESGQLQIAFGCPEPAGPAASATRSMGHDRPPDTARCAWDWFDLALELEAADPGRAYEAYTRALFEDPQLWDAHVNLGRLLQLAGRTREAIEHYHSAIRGGSTDPTASFNLGTACEELRRWNQAITAYHRALEIDGQYADAHFNLARLYEQRGQRAAALRHLRAYQRLVQ